MGGRNLEINELLCRGERYGEVAAAMGSFDF